MKAKSSAKTVFYCSECGNETAKWMGQCPACGAWNTLVEAPKEPKAALGTRAKRIAQPKLISELDAEEELRFSTGIGEFDRVLGGGAVRGSLVLVGGAPGIGKSTLLLQICGNIPDAKILYVTGEESQRQLKMRSQRLGVSSDELFVLAETDINAVTQSVEVLKPDILIIDSVQTMYNNDIASAPGSIGQVKDCTMAVMQLAKTMNITAFVIGHVNKEGAIAGPKVLEHMVDCVLYFDTEKDNVLRLLRPHKNRFGSTSEIGLFKMTGHGLEGVENAGEYFAQTSAQRALKGRAYTLALEGSRPLLTEVQALASPTHYPYPRRVATGVDLNRCLMLFAALEKHVGLSLDNKDIYVSIAGGVKLKDPALDLAICAAVISSVKEVAVPHDWMFLAEVGILGQIAKVPLMDRRLEEAQRLGFKTAFCAPVSKSEKQKITSLTLQEITEINELALKLR